MQTTLLGAKVKHGGTHSTGIVVAVFVAQDDIHFLVDSRGNLQVWTARRCTVEGRDDSGDIA